MATTELEERLEKSRAELAQHEENLATVLALLEKADRRRREEPENLPHWNRVLTNLEHCMDEARARVGACQLQISRLERAREGEAQSQIPGHAIAPAAMSPLPAPSTTALDAAQTILNMPLEQLSKLTLEEVAFLHGHISNDNLTLIEQDTSGILGRLELANQLQAQTPDPPQDEPLSPERRRQEVLRNAIDKICANRLNMITPEEAQLVNATYELLSRRLSSKPKDERLKRILGAAVNVLNNRLNAERRNQKAT